MNWIEECYEQNRLAVWMLGITDLQTFRGLVNQQNSDVEKIIATNAKHSYRYAHIVIGKPFPLGEKAIATDADCSYWYARFILKAPFPLGEKAIATDADCSYWYENHFKVKL